MNIDNGGPAFPHYFTQDSIGDCSGMDLRDYLAAHVPQPPAIPPASAGVGR